MPPKQSETTPLLWAQGNVFPGSGPFPPTGSYPANGGTSTPWISPQAYHYYQRNLGPGHRQRNFEFDGNLGKDPHSQFCALTGCPPTNAPPGFRYRPNEKTLYGRIIRLAQEQNLTYNLTATLTNLLLLLQIVLGAVLTGLGGTHIPRYWITLIGATNTVIAGVVAYLKSRGQPMRARMFRDDLERLVCEIENSEIMWLGIAKNVHGYDDIDTSNEVTVRSEVARLTRLFDKAVRANAANNPDLYAIGSDSSTSRNNPNTNVVAIPVDANAANVLKDGPSSVVPGPSKANEDAAPATSSSSKKKEEEEKKRKEEEERKKKEQEEKNKKNEEELKKLQEEADKKKKEEEEKRKQVASQSAQSQSGQTSKNETFTSSSEDKGKGPLDSLVSSTSNTARQFFSSSTTGGTKSSESKTESSGQTSSKQTGGGSGNFGLEDP